MNNNIIIIFLLTILIGIGCKPSVSSEASTESTSDQVSIKGLLEGGAQTTVLLEEMAVREYIPIDTVICDDDGRFQINFKAEQIAFYVLRTGGSGYITLLIEPGQNISFKGLYGQSDQYSLEGSEGSEALLELAGTHKQSLKELGGISKQIRESRDLKNFPEIKKDLDIKFDSITGAFKVYSLDFINKNQESLCILIALYNLYGQGLPVFDPATDFQSYLLVDSLLQVFHPEFEASKLLHSQVLEARATKQKNDNDHRPDVGEIAPDFVSSRPDGSKLALSDLKGSYVLISFWAGWSSLSREEHQYMLDAWKLRAAFPLKILQVSFDEDRSTWTKAIKEDGLEWDHVSDLRRWESAIAGIYGIEKIPSNYLIDPRGEIIARDLFGNDLLRKLENLYSN